MNRTKGITFRVMVRVEYSLTYYLRGDWGDAK